jgi:hypothetical protein
MSAPFSVRVGTGWPLRNDRYIEVRRCCPSSTRVLGLGAGCSCTPANSRGLNGTPPASRNITAPMGYDRDRLAISDRMWLSSQTQPRWKSGS